MDGVSLHFDDHDAKLKNIITCKLIAIWCGFFILILQLPRVILTMVAIKGFHKHVSITVVDSAFFLRSDDQLIICTLIHMNEYVCNNVVINLYV